MSAFVSAETIRRTPRDAMKEPMKGDFAFGGMIGDSRVMRSTVDYVRKLGMEGSANVLVQGEPGTGRSLLARGMHHAGAGGDAPFLSIDCGAAPAAVLESELFGHEPGVFEGADIRRTGIFELAGRGTVYLDNVDRLPARLQPKLFRALQARSVRRRGGLEAYEVHCKAVVSSTKPLERLVAQGSFREDLHQLLSAVRVSLARLRDREDDAVLLARHFLKETVREQGLLPIELSPEAIEVLRAYEWPGNVRELRTVMRQAAEICDGPTIQARHLSIHTRQSCPMLDSVQHHSSSPTAVQGPSLREIEIEAIRSTLLRTKGDRVKSSRILDIPVPELLRKVMQHGLEGLVDRTEAV